MSAAMGLHVSSTTQFFSLTVEEHRIFPHVFSVLSLFHHLCPILMPATLLLIYLRRREATLLQTQLSPLINY